MNTFRLTSAVGLLAVLSFPLGVSAQPAAQTAPAPQMGAAAPTPKALVAADPAVTEAENSLRRVTGGYGQGVNTAADVGRATIALADARIRAAVAQKQTGGVPQSLETVVTQRQKLLGLAEAQYRLGALNRSDLNTARVALAEAQVSSALWTLVTVREQGGELARQLFQSGAVPRGEVDKAAAALQEAQNRFAEALKGSKE